MFGAVLLIRSNSCCSWCLLYSFTTVQQASQIYVTVLLFVLTHICLLEWNALCSYTRWCSILFFHHIVCLSLFRGNKPALIGCLSQECNLTKVEQHLIAIRMLLLSSIGRKNLKCLTDKIRVLLCGNLSCSIAAALIISPANDNCRLCKTKPAAWCWCVMWIGLF